MPLLTSEDRLGKTIGGKYRLDRILGEGGMGVVYAGHHLKLDLPVAVKFLHAQYSRTPEIIERFLREARATSRLIHPNVVGVRDVDVAEEDGSAYMVLEFLEGRSLATHLEHEKVLSVDETLSILLPVCDALAAAHDLGIVHRDIKPDNVFLSRGPDGRITPKVLDFGIAKLTAHGSGPSATATGAVMGTALYMAPEQAMGRTKEVGAVSDVWSTAVMTYECLTGGFPFNLEFNSEMNAMVVMMATITATIVPLSDKRKELGAMSAVLAKALDRNPATRTASMRAFADDLRSAVANVNADVRKSRILSRPPPEARITTGPMAGQAAATPVPVVAPVSRTGTDSFARTALPDASLGAESHGTPGSAPSATGPSATGPSATGQSSVVLPPPTRPLGLYLAGGALLVILAIGGVAVAGLGGGDDEAETTPVAAAVAPAEPPPERDVPTTPVTPTTTAEVETPSVDVPPAGAHSEPRGGGRAAEARAAEARAAEARAAEARVAEARAAAGAAESSAVEARAAEARAAEARAAEARAAEARGAEARAAEARAAEARAAEARAAEARAAEARTGTDHRAGGLTAGEF